jgi:hypothetical protein
MNRKDKPVSGEYLTASRPGPFLVKRRPAAADKTGRRFFRGLIIAPVVEAVGAVAARLIWAGLSIWPAFARHSVLRQHARRSKEGEEGAVGPIL